MPDPGNEPLSDDDGSAVVEDAEKVVRIARILRAADWPGYRDTDTLLEAVRHLAAAIVGVQQAHACLRSLDREHHGLNVVTELLGEYCDSLIIEASNA